MSKRQAKQVFTSMFHERTSEHNPIGMHLSHCFMTDPMSFGGYDCCKYGDKYCPADPKWHKILNEVLKGD